MKVITRDLLGREIRAGDLVRTQFRGQPATARVQRLPCGVALHFGLHWTYNWRGAEVERIGSVFETPAKVAV